MRGRGKNSMLESRGFSVKKLRKKERNWARMRTQGEGEGGGNHELDMGQWRKVGASVCPVNRG